MTFMSERLQRQVMTQVIGHLRSSKKQSQRSYPETLPSQVLRLLVKQLPQRMKKVLMNMMGMIQQEHGNGI